VRSPFCKKINGLTSKPTVFAFVTVLDDAASYYLRSCVAAYLNGPKRELLVSSCALERERLGSLYRFGRYKVTGGRFWMQYRRSLHDETLSTSFRLQDSVLWLTSEGSDNFVWSERLKMDRRRPFRRSVCLLKGWWKKPPTRKNKKRARA
jgi:hypothetical protein